MTTARLHDWQSRLASIISTRTAVPWTRGPLDCCGFANACIEAVTGVDTLARWPKWSNTRQAQRLLQKHGSLRAAVGSALGAEIPVLFAQSGDVGLFLADGEEGLAVWGGSSWVAPARSGLVTVRAEALITAWRCTGGQANG